MDISEEDKEDLVVEATEWTYPVRHDQADIQGGEIIDTLTVQKPAKDGDPETEEPKEVVLVQTQKKEEPRVEDPKSADKPDTTDAEPKMTNTIRLTGSAAEAYGFIMPTQLIKNSGPIADPTKIIPAFQVTPIAQQEEHEPAWRLYVIAQEFINQGIPVEDNACNYFVQAIMRITGYSLNSSYKANHFHKHFEQEKDALNTWEHNVAKFGQKKSKLDKVILNSKPEHAMLMQIRRDHSPHGHVALVVPVNGQIRIFDSSNGKSSRPPSVKKGVSIDRRLKARNPQITLFSMPGLTN